MNDYSTSMVADLRRCWPFLIPAWLYSPAMFFFSPMLVTRHSDLPHSDLPVMVIGWLMILCFLVAFVPVWLKRTSSFTVLLLAVWPALISMIVGVFILIDAANAWD